MRLQGDFKFPPKVLISKVLNSGLANQRNSPLKNFQYRKCWFDRIRHRHVKTEIRMMKYKLYDRRECQLPNLVDSTLSDLKSSQKSWLKCWISSQPISDQNEFNTFEINTFGGNLKPPTVLIHSHRNKFGFVCSYFAFFFLFRNKKFINVTFGNAHHCIWHHELHRLQDERASSDNFCGSSVEEYNIKNSPDSCNATWKWKLLATYPEFSDNSNRDNGFTTSRFCSDNVHTGIFGHARHARHPPTCREDGEVNVLPRSQYNWPFKPCSMVKGYVRVGCSGSAKR